MDAASVEANVEAVTENVTVVAEKVSDQVTQQLSFFQKLMTEMQSNALEFVLKVIFAVLVLIVGSIIIHFIRKILHRSLVKLEQKGSFVHTHFIEETVKIVLYILLIIIIAQYFGVTSASIVAVLGSSLLTVGLAFQGALSNFAGGFLLLFTKPFKIGDYIIIGGGLGEGVVTNVGVVYTTLKVGNAKSITVPNGTLANNTITNLTPESLRFVEMNFPISYSSDISKAKSIVEAIASSDADVVKDQGISVYVAKLDDDSVNIGLRLFVAPSAYPMITWRITEAVKLEFDNSNISIPFKQLDVYIKNNDK